MLLKSSSPAWKDKAITVRVEDPLLWLQKNYIHNISQPYKSRHYASNLSGLPAVRPTCDSVLICLLSRFLWLFLLWKLFGIATPRWSFQIPKTRKHDVDWRCKKSTSATKRLAETKACSAPVPTLRSQQREISQVACLWPDIIIASPHQAKKTLNVNCCKPVDTGDPAVFASGNWRSNAVGSTDPGTGDVHPRGRPLNHSPASAQRNLPCAGCLWDLSQARR